MLDIPSVEAKQRSGPCTKRQRRRAPRTVTFQESNLTPQTATEASPKQRSRTNRVQAHDSYSPVVPELSAWTLNDQLYHKKIVELMERELPQRAIAQSPRTLILLQTRKGREEIDKMGRDFWTEANPEIDAWMIVIGKVRPCFRHECIR